MNNKLQNGFRLSFIILLSFFMTSFYAGKLFAESSTVLTQPKDKNEPAMDQVDNTEMASESDTYDSFDNADDTLLNKDPLERFNRAMFMFNDKLDYFLIKPIAEMYNAILPKPLNQGIHNFFNNLGEIPTIANDLLQLNLYQMAKDFTRLTLNTTLGLGGFVDIATRMHYPYFQNDFGLTLARWGYKNSIYLVLPFLGSNTIRDGIFGVPVDYFGFSVYPYVKPQSTRFQLLTLFMIDHRANLLQFEPVLEEAAIDKYVFMRNAYMQHRAFQIEQLKHLSYRDRKEKDQDLAQE